METKATRTPYPTDVTDEEWAFVAPYLTLMDPEAPLRRHDPREVFNALLSTWLDVGRGRISAGTRESRPP